MKHHHSPIICAHTGTSLAGLVRSASSCGPAQCSSCQAVKTVHCHATCPPFPQLPPARLSWLGFKNTTRNALWRILCTAHFSCDVYTANSAQAHAPRAHQFSNSHTPSCYETPFRSALTRAVVSKHQQTRNQGDRELSPGARKVSMGTRVGCMTLPELVTGYFAGVHVHVAPGAQVCCAAPANPQLSS